MMILRGWTKKRKWSMIVRMMEKTVRKILYGIAVAGIVSVLGGCAATTLPGVSKLTPVPTQTPTPVIKQTPTPTPTPIAIIMSTPTPEVTPVPVSLTPIAEAEEHLKILGRKQEGENVYKVRLINSTGKDIVEVRLISMYKYDDEEYSGSGNLLYDEDVFSDKEERILYYDTSYTATNDAGEKHFHLYIGFEDGSGYTLTDVPFTDIKEAVIYYEDDVAYLVYLSAASGTQISTKDMELIHRSNRAAEEESRRYDEDDYDEDEDDEDYRRKNYDDEDYDEDYEERNQYDDDRDYDDEQYDERYTYDEYDED